MCVEKISEAYLLPASDTSALENFQALIEKLDADTKGVQLYEQADHVIQCSGLYEFYRKKRRERGNASRKLRRLGYCNPSEGTVLNYDGQGAHARVQINFRDAGMKWLMLDVAKLEAI